LPIGRMPADRELDPMEDVNAYLEREESWRHSSPGWWQLLGNETDTSLRFGEIVPSLDRLSIREMSNILEYKGIF